MNKVLIIIALSILITGCTVNTDLNANSNTSGADYGQNETTNIINNETVQEEVIFNVTDCKAGAYDFGSGSESWAASLNCTYYTNKDCREGYLIVTLYSPTGGTLSVRNYCNSDNDYYQNQMQNLRMADEWITPPNGPYKIIATLSGNKVYEKNITFNGYNVSLVHEISGELTYNEIFHGYQSYNSDLEYLNIKITNKGDIPVFTDSITAYVDDASANINPRYVIMTPNRTATLIFSWNTPLPEGTHTLTLRTFGTLTGGEVKISEDTVNFEVPSLTVE